MLTIADELTRTGELKKVRYDYLFALIDYEFTTTRVDKYVKIIKETAQRRELVRLGEELAYMAGDESKDLTETLSLVESRIMKTTTEEAKSTDLKTLLETTWREAVNRRSTGGQLLGASTGIIQLDRLTCGLKKSDLIILAARPAMGKTALAMNIAINAAREVPVGIFSLEMSAES